MIKKYAVMDVGTNTARLMLAQVEDNKIIGCRKFVTTTRIGQGIEADGVLKKEPMERTAEALAKYVAQAKEAEADEMYIFATNAVRSATNTAEFVDMVADCTGLPLHVISGEEEAMAGYAGAVGMGLGTLIDIGGGSTEVITGNAEGITFAKSLEMGVVRLLDRLGQYDKAKKDEYFAYINGVLQQLQGLEQTITPNLIGVSGTATTAVAIKLGLETYSPEKVQGTVLTAKEIEEMLDMLASLSLEERKQVTGLSPQRADVICHGLSVLYCFMIGYGFDEITVSDRDNLEGYLTLRLNGYFGA